jgi:hypothetical protein
MMMNTPIMGFQILERLIHKAVSSAWCNCSMKGAGKSIDAILVDGNHGEARDNEKVFKREGTSELCPSRVVVAQEVPSAAIVQPKFMECKDQLFGAKMGDVL